MQMAMTFFAVVNLVVFVATLLFVPSMPVKEKLSYGTQLSVLKNSITWLSIVAVILLNAAVFGVFSYIADYLKNVTNLSANLISILLFVYGIANIIGTIVAGKLLTKNAMKTVVIFPVVLGVVYILLFLFGQFSIPMMIMTLIWGILGGIGGNINQFWITSAAPEALDFANGLFLTAANLGTTFGEAIGGLFISNMGIEYVVFVGILSVILGFAAVILRNYRFIPTTQELSN